MAIENSTDGPKHRSTRRRWWMRAEGPAPEPEWSPGWTVVQTPAEQNEKESAAVD